MKKEDALAFGKAVLFLAFGLILVGVLYYFTDSYSMECKESTVYLQELEEGIYAYKENVVSNVPANNYSMITFCSTNGNVITTKGNVTIVYIDSSSSSYAIWVNYYHMTNSDKVTLYVPVGSVKYLGTSGTGD